MGVITRVIAAMAVALGATGGVLVSTASGNGASSPGCGAHVTTNVTLTSDIGPCPPNTDGIVIAADGVTVNLNGHRIIGTDTTNTTKQEQVGVRFLNVYNSTVQGPGEVTHFDAGVFIDGGGSDTVTGVTADANIAHVLLTGGANPSDPLATPCNLGDGITANNSSGNTISNSSATNNGPYSGMSLVGASSNNTVSGNDSYNNDVSNILPPGITEPNGDKNGPCGPFSSSKTGEGRLHQDIGIRIEGPGATNNVLNGNSSTGNQLEGISIHANVCPKSSPTTPQATPPNTNNLVEYNTVSGNGFADKTDGIAILSQGPAGVVCTAYNNTIAYNTSSSNARDGVFVGGRGASGNVVTGNTTNSNGKDGVELAAGSYSYNLGMALPGATGDTVSGNTANSNGTANSNSKGGIALDGPYVTVVNGNPVNVPGATDNTVTGNTASGNTPYDGYDGNPGCDSNIWSGDVFGTVNQTCVK